MKSVMNMRNRGGVDGWITIREISKETGEILSEFTDKNVITEQGINTLFLRMVLNDNENTMKFSRFKLGIDYGLEEDANADWTVFTPKPAEKHYTSLNQYVVYEVPELDMVFDYPDQNTFQASTLLDGKYILDTYHPDDVDLRYTSATLRFFNETTFSYKRFPVRSLSRLIDVQIIWTFKFVNEYDYVCPVPPYESILRLYSAELGNGLYRYDFDSEIAAITQTQVSPVADINVVRAMPNGDVIYIEYASKRMVILNEAGEVQVNRVLSVPGRIECFDVDQFGFIYAGLSGTAGNIAKLDPLGEVVWVKSIAEGKSKSVHSIWVVNNSRFMVSTNQPTNDSPDTSGNMVHLLDNAVGNVIYATSFANSIGKTGSLLTGFSSSGGEMFVIQKNPTVADCIIKVAYDLSEISRLDIEGDALTAFAAHDNFIVFGGGSYLNKYNADLEYIWKVRSSDGSVFHQISVDRDDNIHACSAAQYHQFDADLNLQATHQLTTIPTDVSAVGSKWTYFG